MPIPKTTAQFNISVINPTGLPADKQPRAVFTPVLAGPCRGLQRGEVAAKIWVGRTSGKREKKNGKHGKLVVHSQPEKEERWRR